MTYSSSEREFYLRHYGGGFAVGGVDLQNLRAQLFTPGKRYHLLYKHLKSNCAGGTIVEVGCSDTGAQSLIALKEEFGFCRAIGIDIALEQDQTIGGVELLAANFNHRLPLEDSSVDVFVAMMVIEHLFDPFHAFSEIKRLLSADGFAAVNLPLVTGIKNRLRLCCGVVPVTSVPFERWLMDREWDGNHLHYFSISSIKALAAGTGLRVTNVSAVGKAHKLKECWPSLLAGEITFTLEHARQ